jgi:flagellar motor component MotA
MKDIVRTSEKNWLEKALKLYTEKKLFRFIDDAELKLTEKDLKSAISLIRAAKSKSGVTWQQIAGVLAGAGITSAGVWIIAAAIADPEPTTKLGLLIAGGTILALTGSLGTFASLGVRFSVSAKLPQGHEFEIKPE